MTCTVPMNRIGTWASSTRSSPSATDIRIRLSAKSPAAATTQAMMKVSGWRSGRNPMASSAARNETAANPAGQDHHGTISRSEYDTPWTLRQDTVAAWFAGRADVQPERAHAMMVRNGVTARLRTEEWPVGQEPTVRVAVRQLDPALPVPAYAHPGDAGADLYAAAEVRLPPGARTLVPTGVAIALPAGYVGLVHPRSGLAHHIGVTVLNAPGTVDAGYRGEILVNLINHDPDRTAIIARGDRIAQLVVQRVERADFEVVDELSESSDVGGRGIGESSDVAGRGIAESSDVGGRGIWDTSRGIGGHGSTGGHTALIVPAQKE